MLAIFDLDGTILDTLDDLTDALNYALTRAGLPICTSDQVRSYVGSGIKVTISRAVPPETDASAQRAVYNDLTDY